MIGSMAYCCEHRVRGVPYLCCVSLTTPSGYSTTERHHVRHFLILRLAGDRGWSALCCANWSTTWAQTVSAFCSLVCWETASQYLASARSSSDLLLPFVSRCIESVDIKTKLENTLQNPPKWCFVVAWLVVLDTEPERGGLMLLWCFYMHLILAGWRRHMDTRHNLTCVFIWLFE